MHDETLMTSNKNAPTDDNDFIWKNEGGKREDDIIRGLISCRLTILSRKKYFSISKWIKVAS